MNELLHSTPEWVKKNQLKIKKRCLLFSKAVSEIEHLVPQVHPGSLVLDMESIYREVEIGSNCEPASEAMDRLMAVAAAANALKVALSDLGPGGSEAIVEHLRKRKLPISPEVLQLPNSVHRSPFAGWNAPAEERSRVNDEYQRGGRWLVQLKALAEGARGGVKWIRDQSIVGGKAQLQQRLFGTPAQRTLFLCKAYLDRVEGHSNALLPMARAIEHARTGKEPGPQALRNQVKHLFATHTT